MIKLIVGLGNPGKKYQKTRHNVGSLFLDYLLKTHSNMLWAFEAKFQGYIATIFIANSKIILFKPQSFVNLSGLPVGSVARYYKFKAEEILVVHDELDFTVGIVKFKKGGSHAGHNGLRSIITNLNESNFYRLRLGINRPIYGKSVADYVLSNPSKSEQTLLSSVFAWLDLHLDKIITGNLIKVTNVLHKALA